MKRLLSACAFLALVGSSCVTPDYGRALPPGAPALIPLEAGDERPNFRESWADRGEIMLALEHSIAWHHRASSQQFFPIENVSHRRSLESLERFKSLLQSCTSPEDFDASIAVEFDIYKSAGWDAEGGGVLFTGYCTPILNGSLTGDSTYRWPLYSLPDDLVKGKDGVILGQRQNDGSVAPYPTRAAIEASGHLRAKKLELVYLADPMDAFIAHVNGSAVIRMPDGTERKYGYAGTNGREYRSLGRMLVEDGHLEADLVSLPTIRAWGRANPDKLLEYIEKDDSFVFFLEIDGPPKGSLNVDVTGGRTLATDKTLFPRGAIVFVDVDVPKKRSMVRSWWDELWDLGGEDYESAVYDRFMFDQDTGGAIRTAGRADIYMGVGDEAEWTAGRMRAPGQMYYLFLKAGAESVRP